jgi:hypothetical protein
MKRMAKKLLILKASEDICAAEVDHLKTIADMFGMVPDVFDLTEPASLLKAMIGRGKYDYIYLGAHANESGFGEGDGSTVMLWPDFALALCASECLNRESILLLGCCRGGLRRVAMQLFTGCTQIDYVCGPRWTVTGLDITAGFHVFIYNMEVRHEQPSCAIERASKATGYDFFCYDRVEVEDGFWSNLQTDPNP